MGDEDVDLSMETWKHAYTTRLLSGHKRTIPELTLGTLQTVLNVMKVERWCSARTYITSRSGFQRERCLALFLRMMSRS